MPEIRDGARIPELEDRPLVPCPSIFSNKIAAARGIMPRKRQLGGGNAREIVRTHDLWICLFSRARRAHGIGLARAGLAVRKDGDIVALDEGVYTLAHIFEDAFLINVLAKDAVKHEDLPASRSIDLQTGGGCDMAR